MLDDLQDSSAKCWIEAASDFEGKGGFYPISLVQKIAENKFKMDKGSLRYKAAKY